MIDYTLEDLCEIVIGRTPSRAEPRFWGGDFPWVSIGDMTRSRVITRTKECVSESGLALFSGRIHEPGTVLLSFKLSIGKVAIAGVPLVTNEAIAGLRPRHEAPVFGPYLARILRALPLQAGSNEAARGSTLNKKSLGRVRVPLPDLDSQIEMSIRMDEVERVGIAYGRAAELAGELLSSLQLSAVREGRLPPLSLKSPKPDRFE